MSIANEHLQTITTHLIGQIEVRLREAHLVSVNAKAFKAQGLDERATEGLMDVEPLVFEAKGLLEAVTILRRERSL